VPMPISPGSRFRFGAAACPGRRLRSRNSSITAACLLRRSSLVALVFPPANKPAGWRLPLGDSGWLAWRRLSACWRAYLHMYIHIHIQYDICTQKFWNVTISAILLLLLLQLQLTNTTSNTGTKTYILLLLPLLLQLLQLTITLVCTILLLLLQISTATTTTTNTSYYNYYQLLLQLYVSK